MGAHRLEQRHGGLKKQSLGFGGRSGACSRPLSPSAPACFSPRGRRDLPTFDRMSGDRAQEASACIFLVLA